MTDIRLDQFFNLTKKYFKIYLGIGISVFLFILFFQPFAIEKLDFENKLLFIAGFGIIIIVILFLNQIIFQHLLSQKEKDETTDSLISSLYYFSLTGLTSLAFIFYLRYVGLGEISLYIVAKVVFICISLPVTIHLRNKIDLYQQRIKSLQQENQSFQNKLKRFYENDKNKFVELISENESENFQIQVSNIVFVKSADNYVEVGFQNEGEVKKKMIRNTLKNVESQLRKFNNFIRTHRTSLVNIDFIEKLNKNFNTYWLSLDNTNETIPVSRQYLLSVKNML